jgi:hypothetical protein
VGPGVVPGGLEEAPYPYARKENPKGDRT